MGTNLLGPGRSDLLRQKMERRKRRITGILSEGIYTAKSAAQITRELLSQGHPDDVADGYGKLNGSVIYLLKELVRDLTLKVSDEETFRGGKLYMFNRFFC